MVESVLRYPIRGPWLERTAIGSLFIVASVFVLPAVVLVGYCLRVLERTLEGSDDPPAFDDWGRLLRRGLSGTVVVVVYLLGPIVAGVTVLVGLGIVGYAALTAMGPFVAGQETAIWLVSIVAALVASLLALVVVSVTLVVYFALPAALARVAVTGRIRAAFDRHTLRPMVLNREYVVAMGALQTVPLVVPIVALCCLVTIVGIVVLPAIPFLTALWCSYVVGIALRRADSRTTADESAAAVDSTLLA